MNIVVGLGNPGEDYRGTRHNAGHLVVAGLAHEHGIVLGAGVGDFVSGAGKIAGADVTLILPLTYMNRSGSAILDALRALDCQASDLLVVCDDVDLELGRLRFRRAGSSGGHKGVASIIDTLGTEEFARLRLGVGRPPGEADTADYVLDRFHEAELPLVEDMKSRASAAVALMLREGIEAAMNTYNERPDRGGGVDSQGG